MSSPYRTHKGLVLYSTVILSFALFSFNNKVLADEITTTPIPTTETLTANENLLSETSNTDVNENKSITTYTNTVPTTKSIQPEVNHAVTEPTSTDPSHNQLNVSINAIDSTSSTSDNLEQTNNISKYDQLLNEWNSTIAGNDVYDASNPYMAEFNKQLEETVERHLETYNSDPNRTYLWEDKSNYNISATMTGNYKRLEEIAKQVTNPHSKYFQNQKTIDLVKGSLEFLYQTLYNENTTYTQIKGKSDINWWDYEIGTPRAINNTLSLMKPYFSHEDIMKYTQPIEILVPDPTIFRANSTDPNFPTFKAAVGNMTDMGRVKLIAGLLRQDDTTISDTIKSIETAFSFVTEGNGFYEDGSLIDHVVTNEKNPLYNKGIAYNGSYGNVLIDGLSQLIPIIQKTDSPMAQEKMDVIYHWINESFFPLIVHGELMDMTRGRAISRQASESHAASVELLRAILRIANMSSEPEKTTIKTQIKSMVSEGNKFYNVYNNLKTYRDIQLMDELLNDSSIPVVKPENYIKPYNSMDKLAAYNANNGYGIGLSMFSDKTQNFESMNKENLRGWHTGDGMFYLYNGDLGHYNDNYWATVNPYKLPGTTETDAKRLDGTPENIAKHPEFVGIGALPDGAFVKSNKIDDVTGISAMTFTNFNKTLSVNKGWFILDGKIVFVGTNIQNTSTDTASTTIDQRKEDKNHPYKTYLNDQPVILPNSLTNHEGMRTIFLESDSADRNIGYIFFDPTSLSISKAIQTGKWSDIKGDEKSPSGINEVSNTFITISQPHKGNGDNYAYMIVPNLSREEFNRLFENLDIQIIQNDKNASIIYDPKTKQQLTINYLEKSLSNKIIERTDNTSTNLTDHNSDSTQSNQTLTNEKASTIVQLANTQDNMEKGTSETLPHTGQSKNSLSIFGLLLLSLSALFIKPFKN